MILARFLSLISSRSLVHFLGDCGREVFVELDARVVFEVEQILDVPTGDVELFGERAQVTRASDSNNARRQRPTSIAPWCNSSIRCRLALQQLPRHGLQNAAVAVVVELDRRVDAHRASGTLSSCRLGVRGDDRDRLPRLEAFVELGDVEDFFAGEAERLPGGA